MRPLSEWLELMLAEIAQRQEQARAVAAESEDRCSGDPTVQQPSAQELPQRESQLIHSHGATVF